MPIGTGRKWESRTSVEVLAIGRPIGTASSPRSGAQRQTVTSTAASVGP